MPTESDLARLTRDQREDYEERAALIEYLAGLPRPEAEREAYAMITGQRQRSLEL
jgi:hypothetical protein